jgi:hypothetical protein
MNLVRTSIAVASVCSALAWSTESLAQGSADATKTTNAKGTTGTSGSTSTGTTSTTGTGTSDASGTGPSGTTGSGTSGSGSGASGTTGTSTDTSGMSGSGTMGSSTDVSGRPGMPPYDTSGSTYPLGYGTQSQGAYGQPGVGTAQTTSAMYDPTASADREGGTTKVRPNRPLLITGSAIFLGSYAATAIQGAASPLDADRKNLIPLVGPWINMSERPCNLNTNCSAKENANNALLIGSGIAQGAGIALVLLSLVVPETKERSAMTAKAEPPKPEFRVLPASMGNAGAGAFAVGTF